MEKHPAQKWKGGQEDQRKPRRFSIWRAFSPKLWEIVLFLFKFKIFFLEFRLITIFILFITMLLCKYVMKPINLKIKKNSLMSVSVEFTKKRSDSFCQYNASSLFCGEYPTTHHHHHSSPVSHQEHNAPRRSTTQKYIHHPPHHPHA